MESSGLFYFFVSRRLGGFPCYKALIEVFSNFLVGLFIYLPCSFPDLGISKFPGKFSSCSFSREEVKQNIVFYPGFFKFLPFSQTNNQK